jgi:hypothetical protein
MGKMSPCKTKGSLDSWIKKQLIKDGLQECNKRAMEQKLCFISQCASLFSSQKWWLQLCFQSFLTYKMYQEHLMVFEIWKPACPLSGASIQIITTYSDVEKERWSVQHRIVAVELFIKTEPVTAIQHGFWQQFLRCDAPSHNTLLLQTFK